MPDNPHVRRLLTVNEAAGILDVVPDYLLNHAKRGHVPAVRIRHRIYFREADVLAFKASGQEVPKRAM